MRITLGKLVAATPSIEKIIKEDLPAKTAYRLSRLLKAAQTELESHEKQRIALVKKFGTEEKAGDWAVQEDKLKEFGEEFSALQAEEVELWYDPVTLDMLLDAKLSAVDMMLLEPFIVE